MTPFYEQLSDVGTSQFGTNADGSSLPPILFATTRHLVSVEADADLGMGFNLRTAT